MAVTAPVQAPAAPKRRRLDHIDAMRPLKQAGVLASHIVTYFAPAGLGASGVLLLTHFSREGFFFVSACMLTYAYRGMGRSDLPRFYRRRFVSVGVPYLCWSALYFGLWLARGGADDGAGAIAATAASYTFTGWYHLYYLLIIMQFYVVYPLLLAALRRTERWHGRIVLGSLALQFVLMEITHLSLLPDAMLGTGATRNILFYQFYLLSGAIAAFHLDRVHAWLCGHVPLVLAGTVGAAVVAELLMVAAEHDVLNSIASGSDPFQPAVVPFNAGIIASLYLLGVWLVSGRRSARLRAIVRSAADNSYGVYLSHMLFVTALSLLGWQVLGDVVPWPVLCAGTLILVYLAGCGLTAILARTPLAVPLTGGRRRTWRSLRPARQEGSA